MERDFMLCANTESKSQKIMPSFLPIDCITTSNPHLSMSLNASWILITSPQLCCSLMFGLLAENGLLQFENWGEFFFLCFRAELPHGSVSSLLFLLLCAPASSNRLSSLPQVYSPCSLTFVKVHFSFLLSYLFCLFSGDWFSCSVELHFPEKKWRGLLQPLR